MKQKKETKKSILEAIGGLSKPGKIPCHGYSLPVDRCPFYNSKNKKGTVCDDCYAGKGRYVFPNVKNAMEKRYQLTLKPEWVENMAKAINTCEKSGFFRWHDSGELYSYAYLCKVMEVIRLTPSIRHWLPTRNTKLIKRYSKKNTIPENVTIRISGMMVNDIAFDGFGFVRSAVIEHGKLPADTSVNLCHATTVKGGICGGCRNCWNSEKGLVVYLKH